MSGIIKRRKYKNYDEYVTHQIEKTADPKRRKRLLQKSNFDGKVVYFKDKFQCLLDDGISLGQTVCLGARMGEEIEALLQLGVDCYGVDLVPHPPHVKEGDFQDLYFIEDGTVDSFYTNSLDHASDPEKVFSEVSRGLKDGGIFILDYFYKHWEDHAASYIKDPNKFFANIGNSMVLTKATPVYTMSNLAWELIFKKIENSIERDRIKKFSKMKLFKLKFKLPEDQQRLSEKNKSQKVKKLISDRVLRPLRQYNPKS